MKTIYVGLDCSLNSTGLAISCDNEIITKTLSFEPNKDGKKVHKRWWTGKRQIEITNAIFKELDETESANAIDWVGGDYKFIFEAFVMSANSRSVLDQAELAGMIKGMIYARFSDHNKYRISILEVPPGTLKEWHTGKGNADKFKMVQVCNDVYDTNFFMDTTKKDSKKNQDDECDAYCLIQFAKYLDGPNTQEVLDYLAKCQVFSNGFGSYY